MLLLCYSPDGHKLLLNTRNNSDLLAIEIDKLHDRQHGHGTCQFHLQVTQLTSGFSFGRKSLQVGRNSLNALVCDFSRSEIGRKSLLKCLSHANFCRVTQVTRGVRGQVVGRSLIDRKTSKISRRSVASVSRRLGCGCGSATRVYTDRLTNGVRGSRARKSVVVRSQVTLIT